MRVLHCQQGSPEWVEARVGVITASECKSIITPARLQPSKSREPYLHRLAAEWFLGRSLEDFGGNRWTERGKELEPHARRMFAFEHNVEPQQVGFVYRDETELIGCSPDWLMPGAGGEVKCPAPGTHVGLLLGPRECPTDYVPQVQMSLWVCREQCDHWFFVSYCPEMPLFSVRCDPDPAWQAALDEHMPAAVDELLSMRERLRAMVERPADEPVRTASGRVMEDCEA